ncbi:DNA binding protein [Bacillus phage YungSlug]|nr:DNA binding protein [Bacillus phage YungSlug]
MKFLSAEATNFLSVRNVTIQLSNQGLVFIEGRNNDDPAFKSNGAGKSTIPEIITFGLFEKTIRGLKPNEVVNNTVGKNCMVAINFIGDDGAMYRIERYRKDKTHKNMVFLHRDGINITAKSTTDTNALIEKIIQLDYQTYANSIIFGQGLVKMFSVATDAEKKQILEKILGMEKYAKALENAKEKLKEKNIDLGTAEKDAEHNKSTADRVIAEIESFKALEEKHKIKTQEEIDVLTDKLAKQHDELKQAETEANAGYDSMKRDVQSLIDTYDEQLQAFEEIRRKRDKAQGTYLGACAELTNLKSGIVNLKNKYQKVEAGTEKTCPTCGQDIPVDKEGIENALKHIKEQMLKDLKEQKLKEESVDKYKKAVEELDAQLEGKRELEQKKSKAERTIFELDASIKVSAQKVTSIKNSINETIGAINSKKADLDKTYKSLIEDREHELGLLSEGAMVYRLRKEELKRDIAILEFWVKAYGNAGIKSYMLNSVTPFLNEKANGFLGKLAGNTTEIKFSTQKELNSGEKREQFEVQINNLVGGTSYTGNSVGERRRVDIAIQLALFALVKNRSGKTINFVFFDEMFEGLDEVGCENVVQILTELGQEIESIYVVSHTGYLSSYFDHFLVATKENGETKITKE